MDTATTSSARRHQILQRRGVLQSTRAESSATVIGRVTISAGQPRQPLRSSSASGFSAPATATKPAAKFGQRVRTSRPSSRAAKRAATSESVQTTCNARRLDSRAGPVGSARTSPTACSLATTATAQPQLSLGRQGHFVVVPFGGTTLSAPTLPRARSTRPWPGRQRRRRRRGAQRARDAFVHTRVA